jgi:hypothetical protein
MRWTAPTTGIAMRQDTVDVAERFESAYGTLYALNPKRLNAPNPTDNRLPGLNGCFRADGRHD